MPKFYRILLISIVLIILSCNYTVLAQATGENNRQLEVLEKEYNELLRNALQQQIKADSLVRLSNLKRQELTNSTNESAKLRLGAEILELEKSAFQVQGETNRNYARAREIEMRMLALKRNLNNSISDLSSEPNLKPAGIKSEDGLLLAFLYGRTDIEPYIGPLGMERLKSIEGHTYQVNKVFNNVSEINQEIENLKIQIDAKPRSRTSRNARKRIEELGQKVPRLNMEALSSIEPISLVKLEVLTDVVNSAKTGVTSRDLIQRASVHENASREHVLEANESRKVAIELSNEKFSQEYLLRAYQRELNAIDELFNAFDVLKAKSPETSVIVNEIKQDEIPNNPPLIVDNLPQEINIGANNIPLNVRLPDGLTYRIQVGIYHNDVALPDFKELPQLTGESEEGSSTTRFFSGMYPRFSEAERALLDVRRMGFRDAFIVSYFDGKRIPVNRAAGMEEEGEHRLAVAPNQIFPVQPAPVFPTSVATQPIEQAADLVIFKVQIGVFRNLISSENRDRFMRLAGNQKLELTQNNSGLYVYTIGNFNTFEEASWARKKLVDSGLKDAFVVAFKNGERLPLNQIIK